MSLSIKHFGHRHVNIVKKETTTAPHFVGAIARHRLERRQNEPDASQPFGHVPFGGFGMAS